MGNVQFVNDKVLFTAADKVAMDPACCCGGDPEYDCPGDCSGCPANFTLVVTGFTGQQSAYNGTYQLAHLPDVGMGDCYWYNADWQADPTVEILCSGSPGEWQVNLFDFNGLIPMATAREIVDQENDCPPAGTWTFFDAESPGPALGTGDLTTP